MPVLSRFGYPRVHVRCVDSTNTIARDLAASGAPHGTLVSADEQLAGRGRQGRRWSAPAGQALLCSWVIRDPGRLLSLAAGVAVAEACGPQARIKWPNDVLIEGRKVSGILVEGRPQEHWAVLGIGINTALDITQLPPELRDRAGTLDLGADEVGPLLISLCALLDRWLAVSEQDVLSAFRDRDALLGETVAWDQGSGTAAGIDADGRLLVATERSDTIALDAGEVHLIRPAGGADAQITSPV
jgi:BirA family biotin operon repressor/biotin-[acetyl-CoA-carboxylase] ligase